MQEERLLPMREAMHERFNLCKDRPMLRIPQALSFVLAPQREP
jgi:hypothetical protein